MSVVMKFGGSSVADATCLREVADLVEAAHSRRPLVVLSATRGSTDALFGAARQAQQGDAGEAIAVLDALFERHRGIAAELPGGHVLGDVLTQRRSELEMLLRGVALLRELTPRTMDAIASHGERLSTALLAAHLDLRGVPITALDARAVVRTDARFGAGRPDRHAIAAACREHLLPRLTEGRIVVTEGYVGATKEGLTTTLGRGGSDFSAALLGAAIGAEEVEIWTDVEGVLAADPRRIPGARTVPEMTFAEAAELAAFGAKVLHPATIQPALEAGIPVSVRHTRRPKGKHTVITPSVPSGRGPITALASRGPITILTLSSTRMLHQSGYLARVFEVFGRLDVSVDVVATAEVAVSCTVGSDAPLDQLVAELAPYAHVGVAENRALVAVVGEGLKRTPGLAGRILGALGDLVPELISMGGNEINLSIVVPAEHESEAIRRLHRAFFEEAP